MANERNGRSASAPAPRKRFRIDRLEERIAPKVHKNPQSKEVGGSATESCANTSFGGGSVY